MSRTGSNGILKINGLRRIEVGSGVEDLEDWPDVGAGAVVAEAVIAVVVGVEGFEGVDFLDEVSVRPVSKRAMEGAAAGGRVTARAAGDIHGDPD